MAQSGRWSSEEGERRYVQLRMYELGVGNPISFAQAGGRFLHTTTALPDGRVLITGGFSSISPVTCPTDVPTGSACHRAVATNSALVFVPASGLLYEVAGGMGEARAGHTATSLLDGRVLIAGGAAAATLAVAPNGSTFELILRPVDTAGNPAASGSFEVFLPETPTEDEDIDGDGDPGRGRFIPAPTDRGLNEPRFLHAAARLEGSSRVVVAGGLASSRNFEVFDEPSPGDYGFYPPATDLVTPRAWPAALSMQGRVWIVGGSLTPAGNQDLAEVWQPTDPTVGSVTPATVTFFPNLGPGNPTARPEYALRRPAVTVTGDGNLGVVTGWLGPLCDPGTTTETFFAAATPSELCGVGTNTAGRSFVINGLDGSTSVLPLTVSHAYGTATTLRNGPNQPDTAVVVAGGLASDGWGRTELVDVLVPNGNQLQSVGAAPLAVARAFHSAAGLRDGGLFVAGGLALSDDFSTATLVASAEVLYLGVPP